MRDHLRDLIGHQFSADAELWRAFLSSPDPENAGIRRRWYHVHVVQRAFLEIANGLPVSIPTEADLDHVTALREFGETYHLDYQAFLRRATPAYLASRDIDSLVQGAAARAEHRRDSDAGHPA